MRQVRATTTRASRNDWRGERIDPVLLSKRAGVDRAVVGTTITLGGPPLDPRDGAAAPGCLAALNTNGDGDVNIADPVALLNFLFGGGPMITAPYPDCGPGMLPADPVLGCANPPDCQ